MFKIEYVKLTFNGLKNMVNRKKTRTNFAGTLLMGTVLALACSISIGATYYVDPVKGLDTNTGTITASWKTIAFAQSNKSGIAPGDTVYLKSGNYGVASFKEQFGYYAGTTIYGTSWALPITYKAVPGANVVFTNLTLYGHSGEPTNGKTIKRYLIFEDININAPALTSAIGITNSSHLKFNNIKIVGTWGTYASDSPDYGIRATNLGTNGSITEDIYIENCEISQTRYGILFDGKCGTNMVIRNTNVHTNTSSGIKVESSFVGGTVLIEGCKIYDQQPKLESVLKQAPGDWTHGSGIAILQKDITVRNCVIRDYGGSNPLRAYQSKFPIEGYSNLTIENNLIYDSRNTTPVYLQDLGSNIKITNNTFIGKKVTRVADGTPTNRENKRNRYDMALALSACTNGATNVRMYNNVLVGEFASSGIGLTKPYTGLQEDNNIIFGMDSALLSGTTPPYIVGSNTKLVCYAATLGIDATYILDKNYFEGSNNFFVGGVLFDLWSYNSIDEPAGGTHGQDLDDAYKLAKGSEGIGFASIATAPIADLDFNVRDAKPDAGCYEYISTATTTPVVTTAPAINLVIAPIDAKTVTEGQAIAFDVVVTGAAANLVICTIENLPAGATFTNKHFAWTPASGQAGLYFLKITATCADANTTRYVAVTVQQNASYHTPAFGAFTGTSVFEAEQLSVAINTTDPDGDKLIIEARNLPVGAIFYDNKLIWVPDYGTAGTYKVQFTASDGKNQAATEVNIVIKKAASETYPGKRLIYYWQTTLSLLGKI